MISNENQEAHLNFHSAQLPALSPLLPTHDDTTDTWPSHVIYWPFSCIWQSSSLDMILLDVTTSSDGSTYPLLIDTLFVLLMLVLFLQLLSPKPDLVLLEFKGCVRQNQCEICPRNLESKLVGSTSCASVVNHNPFHIPHTPPRD